VSELPRSAPGANPSAWARFIGASASVHTRPSTVHRSGSSPMLGGRLASRRRWMGAVSTLGLYAAKPQRGPAS